MYFPEREESEGKIPGPLEDIVYIKRRFWEPLRGMHGYGRSYEWPHFHEWDFGGGTSLLSFFLGEDHRGSVL